MIPNSVMFSSKSCEWPTPIWLYNTLNVIEGRFDLDAAATAENTKCPEFLSEPHGLFASWHELGRKVWCNPPYGEELHYWVAKGYNEGQHCRVVMLLPVLSDKTWFHEIVMPFAKKIYFVKGRVRFRGAIQAAPFPSMAVVFDSKIRKKGPSFLSLDNWAKGSSEYV